MEKIWILIAVVSFLIVLFVVTRKRKECMETKNKTCLLLTCCVNVRDENEKRIKWYTDCINKYLKNTNLPIRVIESSGYEFDIEHERLKQFTFTTKIELGNTAPSSIDQTRREAESLLTANESGILDDFDMVIKITGKYYVPELEEEISKISDDCGIVYQNGYLSENVPNSEIFGFKREYMEEIFTNMIKGDLHFENFIYNIHEKLKCNSYKFPKKMKIECDGECPYRGPNKDVMLEL